MPTAFGTSENISQIISQIISCHDRCQAFPEPNASRFKQLRQLNNSQTQIVQRLSQIEETEIGDPRVQVISEKSALASAQTSYAARRSALQAEIQSAKEAGKNDVKQTLAAKLVELDTEFQALHDSKSKLITELTAKYSAARQAWGFAEASVPLQKLEEEADQLLNAAGELERQIKLQLATDERAAVDFDSKAAEFKYASYYHQDKAVGMLRIMGGIAVAGAFSVYLLFVNTTLIAEPIDVSDLSQLAFLSVGRIAILIFFGWSLKYTGTLHTSHSAQAIIYRDRAAALGIATNLLKSAPDLQKRQELLQTLARGYLDFEQSAFSRAGKVEPSNLHQVQDAVNMLKPILAELKPFIANQSKRGRAVGMSDE